MRRLAELILEYERSPETSGVVLGMELANEPAWQFWDTRPGQQELYEAMVPELRRLLPADRYQLYLNFLESPRTVGSRWLARMIARDPVNFAGVVYDAHVYHSFGDDNKPGHEWHKHVDSCKTCCRDPMMLAPIVQARVPVAIGEYSLNTGFPGSSEFFASYMRNQLSLWASTPGMVGSFFWNHRILPAPGDWYHEMSLLDLLAPQGPLEPAFKVKPVLCPDEDLSKCPLYDPQTVLWTDECKWSH